ncbi:hypothetical protein KKH05_03385 [Patescibacteria group bacterium]|nr:hypothetical protein [Patescibacteria group bacterium]
MPKFLDKLMEGVSSFFESGAGWGVAVSLADPWVRGWAENSAATIRLKAEARGIKLASEQQRLLVESLLAAFRGAFEMLLHHRIDSKVAIVLLEKMFNDVPDFMANVLFSDEREFEMWLKLRAERGRFFVNEGDISREGLGIGEDVFNELFSEIHTAVREAVGDDAVIPEQLIREQAKRLEQKLKLRTKPREVAFEPMSVEAGELREKMRGPFDKMTDFLLEITHMDFDEEQEAVLQEKEKELKRLQRERTFQNTSKGLDERIARAREKLGEDS